MSLSASVIESIDPVMQQMNGSVVRAISPFLQQVREAALHGRTVSHQVMAEIEQVKPFLGRVIQNTQGAMKQVLERVRTEIGLISADSRNFQEDTDLALALSLSLMDQAQRVAASAEQVVVPADDDAQELARAIELSHGR